MSTPPAPGLEAASVTAVRVRSGEVSAHDVVAAHLARYADQHERLNALTAVDAESALACARELDDRRSRGERLGPLAGLPVSVKDNLDVLGQVTGNGSRARPDGPAAQDATVVARLRAADAVLLGRANMDELAMGASTQTSALGVARNPWDDRRSPGGSSGGCASAVASGQSALSVGTDTGGSVREPAAQCALVGMAPSAGLVPMDGVTPFAPDLDRVGPLARTVADAGLLLSVLAGDPALAEPQRLDVSGLRIGIVEELAGPPNQPPVLAGYRRALETLSALGVELVPVSVPEARYALATYMTLTSAALVPWVRRHVETGDAGEEVVRRYEIGRALLVSSQELERARSACDRLHAQCAAALAACDLLVSPTMPTTAPLLSRVGVQEMADPLGAPYTDCWTVVANLAGLPALTVPAGVSPGEGLPVGVMLTGRDRTDRLLLDVAAALERTLPPPG